MGTNPSTWTWLLGLVSVYFGIKWQSSSKENQTLKQKLARKKEKLYSEFIKLYMDTINKKSNKSISISKLQKLNEQILLVGSNKVLLTYGDLMQTFYGSSKNNIKISMRLMGELISAMREDLGHKDWLNNIHWFDTMRPWIKDIEQYVPDKYKGLRRVYSRTLNPGNEKKK